MYERFTDRARKVMRLANQEAQRFNHEYIGTEHILLGLVREGSGVAAEVLETFHIELRTIRLEVEKTVQAGPDMVTMGKLPKTPRAKKVIEYAIEEARNLNHNYVGTEHLLLGLLREEDGVAAQVLLNLGLELEDVRREVLKLLRASVQSGIQPEPPVGPVPLADLVTRPLHILAALTPSAVQILTEYTDKLGKLNRAKEEAVAEQDFQKAARLRSQFDTLRRKVEEAIQTLRDIIRESGDEAYSG